MLLGERGIEVDHVTVFRWVQRFTPLLADAAGPCRHSVGDRWYVDETYVKVAGRWRYVYRAVDQHGQIIDVYVSPRRDFRPHGGSSRRPSRAHGQPVEVVTERALAFLAAIDELMPARFTTPSNTRTIGSKPTTVDSKPDSVRCGVSNATTATVVIRGHALMQNLRRGHYELGLDARPHRGRAPRSPNSPGRSDLAPGPLLGSTRLGPAQRNRAGGRPRLVVGG